MPVTGLGRSGPPGPGPVLRPAAGNSPGHPPNIEGFTVVGKGFVAAKPDLVEIDLEVIASSELTADAIVKYRDAKRRIHDAFAALKLANVTVDERGLAGRSEGHDAEPLFLRLLSPIPATRPKCSSRGSSSSRRPISARWTRKRVLQLVGRLLDVAQDAGAKVGPQNNMNPYYYYRFGGSPTTGLVRFVLDDFDKIQEEAYEKAIADARDAGRAAGAVEPGRARADRRGPRDRRCPATGQRECRRRAAPQAAGDGEVPGDPGPGRADGAFRGSSQVRREGTKP